MNTPQNSFVNSVFKTLRGVTLAARIVRSLFIVACSLICTIGARAQNPAPPTAAQQQQIQKCHDEATKTNSLVEQSIEARTAATAGALQLGTHLDDTSSTPAQTLAALAATLRKLADAGLPASLTDKTKALSDQKKALSDACGPDVESPQDLVDAQATAKKASEKLDSETTEDDKVSTRIGAALNRIPGAAGQLFDSLAAKVADLKNLAVPKDKEALSDANQRVLVRTLPGFADALEQLYDAKPAWESLSKLDVLASEEARKTAIDAAQKKLDVLDGDLGSVSSNLAAWVIALSVSAADPKQKAADAVTKVLLDPGSNSALAASVQKDANQALSRINAVLGVWPRLSGALKEQPKLDTESLSNNIATLSGDARTLQTIVARIADALAGVMTDFITDHVRLYYFTDVKRLVYALNAASREVGGLAQAQDEAAAQKKALTAAEFDLSDAQADVNRVQKSVLELREQQRQQEAVVGVANLNALRLQNRLANAQRNQQHKEDALAAAKTGAAASPGDPALQAAVTRAQEQKDTATTATANANDQYTSAQSNATSANNQLEATKSDQNGVPARLAAAKQALEAAQASVSAVRRKMLIAAQAESEAFANARDNSPFWVSDAVAADNDPLKHVIIFGFPDNATLVLRGKEDDVTRVKELIAQFDTPAPQARLTLWTFELNSQMGQFYRRGGVQDLNRSMEILDEELGNTRSLVNATIDLLLTSIDEQVRLTAAPIKSEQDAAAAAFAAPSPKSESQGDCSPATSQPGCGSQDTIDQKQALQKAQSVALGSGCTPFTAAEANAILAQLAGRDFDKWRRSHFFSPSVLTAFDFALAKPDVETLKHLLPDPAATTTLGEGLLMLVLSCDEVRAAVQTNFNANLRTRLTQLNLRKRQGQTLEDVNINDMGVPTDVTKAFARTWQALSVGGAQRGGLTSQQFEITFALRDRYELRVRDRIIHTLRRSSQEFGDARKQLDDSTKLSDYLKGKGLELWKKKYPGSTLDKDDQLAKGKAERQLLTPDDRAQLEQAVNNIAIASAKIDSIAARDAPLFTSMCERYNLRPFDLTVFGGHESQAVDALIVAFQKKVPSDGAVARVAAADEMIKRIIIAVEDDIDRLYIQPMLYRLRNRLLNEGKVNVGVIQRESMLATNRMAARIDPSASAQLQVGEEQDILGSVQQLAQLYLAAQTGGAALAVLGGLQKQPREKPPEIYGIGTGNTFQVTPIFDPSGQALRFKFDYVGSTRVTEPSGGVDPQLPRVERHTVNTEVQLSNLETREISRFEATSKIGIPTHYWGGVPILKDVPYVRPYVPLLGWFVRRAGGNAVAQQSVIFGQTTIYPSISDLAVLLSPEDSTSTY